MTDQTGLHIQDLTVNYGEIRLHYQLTVAPGERLAIQGESGAGKSTLLHVIAGFRQADAGTLHWQTEDLLKLPANQRPVSMLFQDHNLFEHLTVWQNLCLGFGSATPDKHQIIQAATTLSVDQQLGKQPTELSGGQRQRIGLIRTLLRPEPVILLDEPFAELDEQTRKKAGIWTREQAIRDNKTVLIVTHHQEDVEAVADRKIILP